MSNQLPLNEVCYRTMGVDEPWTLERYKSLGGYSVWQKILDGQLKPADVVAEVKLSGLRGRGGAGFPTGLKWSFIPEGGERQKYVICNSDESEPGTAKDHEILLNNPHQLLEGLMIACFTTGATVGYNYLRGEFVQPFEHCEKALEEAREAGYLGDNIQGTGISVQLFNVRSGGAYICGEETALMNALEGKKGWPRFKPPFPANYGLYGQPTNINNTETIASVPAILQHGGKWFADKGTAKSGGTKIFSVSGHVNKPGNYEIPLGTSFKDLLDLVGGPLDGIPLKAVIPGGSSMPVMPIEAIESINLDYESIQGAGSMLGSGGMVVMNETVSMPKMLARILKFYAHESCGQCTPCREGSGWVYRLSQRIADGNGTSDDLKQLGRLAHGIEGRTICVFGEAIAWPVAGFLKHYYHEFEAMVSHQSKVG